MIKTVPVLMLVIVIKYVTSGHQAQVKLDAIATKLHFLHLCCFPANGGKSSVSSNCIFWTAYCIVTYFLLNGTGKPLFGRPGFTMLHRTNVCMIVDFKIKKLYGEI